MSNAFVSLQKLSLAYGSNIVVPELDLDIVEGELIALLGPSGCGKTTTMRAIAGLMAPQSGRIYIDGIDMTRMPANKRGIGLVFQSYALFPHLTTFENAAFGLRLKKLPQAEITQIVERGLRAVGLDRLADRKPAEMSGGQQQRLSLARSLVMQPKVLLLDEPLSNLDARLRLEMRAELQRVQKETGITMVFVTHDQSEALALADRIVLMNNGIIEQIGTPDELYGAPKTKFAADFFGFENIFEVEGNTIKGAAQSLPLGFESTSKYLAWRPGAIDVGVGNFSGIVRGSAFAGEQREYIIESKIGQVHAATPAADPSYKIGEEIVFDFPQDHSLPLAR
ncbi:MAG: ABC transporter ATP-binding protein [Rhodobacteraceae bacterium]|nr:ABC transporter ATP-binding protein [Paracoccaceae bacterium]PHR54109.1 MAG: ABC transporter ATP-binding protein [Robiginitomaculum sp.]